MHKDNGVHIQPLRQGVDETQCFIGKEGKDRMNKETVKPGYERKRRGHEYEGYAK